MYGASAKQTELFIYTHIVYRVFSHNYTWHTKFSIAAMGLEMEYSRLLSRYYFKIIKILYIYK